MAEYFTLDSVDLKHAIQDTMVYVPDLAAMVLAVSEDMGVGSGADDWNGLTGQDWTDEFMPRIFVYALNTQPTEFWGVESDRLTMRFTKRGRTFVTFDFNPLDITVQTTTATLTVPGWTRHS